MFLHAEESEMLGHTESELGIKTDPENTEKVKNWLVPKNADELQTFVSFAGYY